MTGKSVVAGAGVAYDDELVQCVLVMVMVADLMVVKEMAGDEVEVNVEEDYSRERWDEN